MSFYFSHTLKINLQQHRDSVYAFFFFFKPMKTFVHIFTVCLHKVLD